MFGDIRLVKEKLATNVFAITSAVITFKYKFWEFFCKKLLNNIKKMIKEMTGFVGYVV